MKDGVRNLKRRQERKKNLQRNNGYIKMKLEEFMDFLLQ